MLSERREVWHLGVDSFSVSACGELMPSFKKLKAVRLHLCPVGDRVPVRSEAFERIHQLNRERKLWRAELGRKVLRLSISYETARSMTISGNRELISSRCAALTDSVAECAREVVMMILARVVARCWRPACVFCGRNDGSPSIDERKFFPSRHLRVPPLVVCRITLDFIQSVGQIPHSLHNVGNKLDVQYLHKRSELRKRSEIVVAIEQLLH